MNEAALKHRLGEELKEHMAGAVVIRHEDIFRSGTPDFSNTWGGSTTWLEVKHANPSPRGKRVQKEICRRLAEQGRCLYVIYRETTFGEKSTMIVHPREVFLGTWPFATVAEVPGFNHAFVAHFVRGLHSAQSRD